MSATTDANRGAETRQTIAAAADDLFYRQGYAATGFADIAAAVGISRGNFYYHFRTKDEILDAVIARRLQRTEIMLAGWETEADDPAERICAFIRILVRNGTLIMAHGCPVGTLWVVGPIHNVSFLSSSANQAGHMIRAPSSLPDREGPRALPVRLQSWEWVWRSCCSRRLHSGPTDHRWRMSRCCSTPGCGSSNRPAHG